jgi:flagellar protein FliJ
MRRAQRLQPLHDMVGESERTCAARLVEVERRVAEGEQRLQELVRYRIEYEQAFSVRAREGAPMRGLREQQTFIARVGEAIRAQQTLLEQLRIECAAARTKWREAATRKQVVAKVIEQAHTEEVMKEEKRQQRESDELASQRRVQR